MQQFPQSAFSILGGIKTNLRRLIKVQITFDLMANMNLLIDQDGPFKHLAIEIAKKLDDKSLTNCRLVNKAFKTLIDQEKFYYVRQISKKTQTSIMKMYLKQHSDWNSILAKFDSRQTIGDLKNILNFLKLFIKHLSKQVKGQRQPSQFLKSIDPLQWIVSKNNPGWVRFLFRFVDDLNSTTEFEINFGKTFEEPHTFGPTEWTKDSWTGLMTACSEGYTDIVRLYFENTEGKTIDWNKKSTLGKTAFMMAVEK